MNPDWRNAPLTDPPTTARSSRRIDDPWQHVGNGAIEDCNGLPVAYVSHTHEAQIPLIVNAPKLLAAAKEALSALESDWLDEDFLRENVAAHLQAAITEAERAP